MAQDFDKNGQLRKQAFGIIGALIVQYTLGMITALFVQFPDDQSDSKMWEFAWSQLPTAAHIILGLFLLIGSSALIASSIKAKNKIWIKTSIVGFLAILFAGLAGALFIPSQKDIYSLAMALAFILALASYGWGIYSSKK